MATTQLGHTTLTMTNYCAFLTLEHLQQSHEKYSPLHMRDLQEEERRQNGVLRGREQSTLVWREWGNLYVDCSLINTNGLSIKL
jgi:hypothetical protein